MKFLLPLFAASVMLLTSSCKHENDSTSEVQVAPIQDAALKVMNEEQVSSDKKQAPQKDEDTGKDWDKKITNTAVISVETEEYKHYNQQIQEIIKKYEGYTAREEESESNGKINNSLTIKVPVSHFDDAVDAIAALNGKMLVKQISSEDVTGEIMDVRTRMEAKKRIRLRYLDMLQKAKNIEEILQVEREVNQIQEQIEAADGRLNYLTHTTSYSTIELSFYQVINPGAVEDPDPGFAKRLLLALNEGLKWMGNLLIFFATLWPLWLILTIGFVVIRRMRPATTNK